MNNAKFILPVLVLLFYLPGLGNGFVNWDDPYIFKENPLAQDFSWHGLQRMSADLWGGHYHRFLPLSMAIQALEYKGLGLEPTGYHLISVLLHAVNAGLVYGLVESLTLMRGAALAAALIFGLHPMAVEPVVWVTAGHYPVGAFFFLMTLLIYVQGLRRLTRPLLYRAATLLMYGLALLSYSQMALSLPLVLVATDYYCYGKIRWGQVFRKAPYLVLAVYFGKLSLQAAYHGPGGQKPTFLMHHAGLFTRMNLSSEALWIYIQKFFAPADLSCIYPMRYYVHKHLFLYSMAGLLITWLFYLRRHHIGWQRSFLGLSWFLLTMAPFLHLVGLSESIIYDRYFYLPSFGLVLMLAGIWEAWCADKGAQVLIKKAVIAAALAWFIWILCIGQRQIALWQDSGRLWTRVMALYPAFPDAYLNRADYERSIHEPGKAMKDMIQYHRLAHLRVRP